MQPKALLRLPPMLIALASPCVALCADFGVDSLLDDGPGSLRAAIVAANASPGADRIVFAEALAGEVIWINAPAPVVASAIDVEGPGAEPVVLRSTGSDRVLAISTSVGEAVAMRRLVLADGRKPDQGGGCLSVVGASLLLDHVRLTGCEARHGGALGADQGATLELRDSRIDHNRAAYGGGGLFATVPVRVERSEIHHNAVQGPGAVAGGGIVFQPGDLASPLVVVDSHLHHNAALTTTPEDPGAQTAGGGIHAGRGSVRIERSTVEANRARSGAGLTRTGVSGDAIEALIVNSTFADNSGSSAIAVLAGSVRIAHSTVTGTRPFEGAEAGVHLAFHAWADVPVAFEANVVAGNYAGLAAWDLYTGGTPVSATWSLVQHPHAASIDPANPGSNLVGVDPGLGDLGWNGGPTPTMLPLPSSPLLDAGPATAIPATDQRGLPRLSGARVDIGAVERDADALFADGFEASAVP